LYQATDVKAELEAVSVVMNLEFTYRNSIVFNRAALVPSRQTLRKANF
jgi:hypothetical protein